MNDLLGHLWSAQDLDAWFGEQERIIAPWTRAPRSKHVALFDHDAVSSLLSRPATLTEVDPRTLHANQPWILRHHVAYYLTGEWERTGRTSADRYRELNQYPVVVKSYSDVNVILAGHHRAAAALLEGRPLLVRVAAADQRCCITPRLGFDPGVPARDPIDVATRINAGDSQSVSTLGEASVVLELLGLKTDEIDWRLAGVKQAPAAVGDPRRPTTSTTINQREE